MRKLLFFLVYFALTLLVCAQSEVTYSSSSNADMQKILAELENNMTKVSGGSFEMGDESLNENQPVHKVWLSSFRICKYDVTQSLWETIMGNNPSGSMKCDDCPVEKVSWNDAKKFIVKLNKLTGKNYRLPYEAEWEYAAKGGNKSNGYKFSGGNNIDSVGWSENNSDNKSHPVGQKSANELGLYDMTGDVLQWCSDWFDCDYYKYSPDQNPHGPDSGETKVLRGGAWNITTPYCRVTIRPELPPDSRYYNAGLRLALDL
jgi:sulfatase modifying factor 1